MDRLQPEGSAPRLEQGKGLSKGSLFYGKERKIAKSSHQKAQKHKNISCITFLICVFCAFCGKSK
jgi:hypothetical protein